MVGACTWLWPANCKGATTSSIEHVLADMFILSISIIMWPMYKGRQPLRQNTPPRYLHSHPVDL